MPSHDLTLSCKLPQLHSILYPPLPLPSTSLQSLSFSSNLYHAPPISSDMHTVTHYPHMHTVTHCPHMHTVSLSCTLSSDMHTVTHCPHMHTILTPLNTHNLTHTHTHESHTHTHTHTCAYSILTHYTILLVISLPYILFRFSPFHGLAAIVCGYIVAVKQLHPDSVPLPPPAPPTLRVKVQFKMTETQLCR